jgi:hypothetical protein
MPIGRPQVVSLIDAQVGLMRKSAKARLAMACPKKGERLKVTEQFRAKVLGVASQLLIFGRHRSRARRRTEPSHQRPWTSREPDTCWCVGNWVRKPGRKSYGLPRRDRACLGDRFNVLAWAIQHSEHWSRCCLGGRIARMGPPMPVSGRSGFLPQDRRAWLLAIGKRLRAEYAAVEEPLPERLAALLKQLEEPSAANVATTAMRRP